MSTKFPIEAMAITLSGAPNNSPIVTEGSNVRVLINNDCNILVMSDGIKKATTDIANFSLKYSALLRDVSDCVNFKDDYEPVITSNKLQITTFLSIVQEFDTRLSSYVGRLNPVELKISDMDNRIINVGSDLTSVKGNVNAIDARVKVLENTGGLNLRVSILESSTDELDRRLTPVETDLSNLSIDSQVAGNKLASLESRISSLESIIAVLQSQIV